MSDAGRRHVERLTEVYREWQRSRGGSSKAWSELMGPTFTFRSLGAGAAALAFARDGASPADLEGYFADLARDWEMIDYQVEQMIAQDDRVAVLSHCAWRNRQTGKVASSLKADFFRFADDHVVEFTEFFDTAGAIAAATP